MPEVVRRMAVLQIDPKSDQESVTGRLEESVTLDEEKERTCTNENMLDIVRAQMSATFLTRLNLQRIDGKLTIRQAPRFGGHAYV